MVCCVLCIAFLMMEALGRWQVTAFGVGEWSSLI